MANLLVMGFERLSSTYLNHANIWDITAPVFAYTGVLVPRAGGSTQGITPSAFERRGVKSLGANYSRLFCGLGYMIRSAAISATPVNCTFTLFDGTTAQIGWKVRSDGSISVHAGDSTAATLLGQTAAGVIVAAGTSGTSSDYRMIELEAVAGTGTSGSFKLRVADVEVLNVSGVNTAPSGTAQYNRFRLINCASGSMGEYQDDLYINDDSGSAPENTFFGEAFVVESLFPNGNGNSSQWVGSDGNSTDNYLLVDDNGNDDTDYVKSGTLNDVDTYAMSDLANTTGTVIRANHMFVARKDDVATRTLASTLRTNSTDYVSGTNKTMAGTYAAFLDSRTINPDTSLRFTIAELNAIECGQKVTT
jgi:hypothetical protein